MTASVSPPAWQRRVLLLAALYNIVWGATTVLFPLALFQWTGAVPPNYPELWQCIGMIVGVYGVGYAAAALNPWRHWPIVLVGLLGKMFGPLGFAWALLRGTFPPAFGWTIVTNDLIWWIPFTLILHDAYHHWREESNQFPTATQADNTLLQAVTSTGQTVAMLSNESPVLLVFLRHAGCTFCRETLAALASHRQTLADNGLQPVLVHMGTAEEGSAFFSTYGLDDLPAISNPDGTLYRAAMLRRGTLGQLFGLNVWRRGWQARQHGVGALQGDGFRLSGYAVVHQKQVRVRHAHADAAEATAFDVLARQYGNKQEGRGNHG